MRALQDGANSQNDMMDVEVEPADNVFAGSMPTGGQWRPPAQSALPAGPDPSAVWEADLPPQVRVRWRTEHKCPCHARACQHVCRAHPRTECWETSAPLIAMALLREASHAPLTSLPCRGMCQQYPALLARSPSTLWTALRVAAATACPTCRPPLSVARRRPQGRTAAEEPAQAHEGAAAAAKRRSGSCRTTAGYSMLTPRCAHFVRCALVNKGTTHVAGPVAAAAPEFATNKGSSTRACCSYHTPLH